MQINLIGQPLQGEDQFGQVVSEALAESCLSRSWFATAWVKRSGVARLASHLEAFRARGGFAEVLLGVDEGGATVEGLRLAVRLFDRAFVFHDSGSRTFHPKIYVVEGDDSAVAIIGSANLTKGGLYTNYEAGLVAKLDLAQQADAALLADLRGYYDKLRAQSSACRLLTDELVDELIAGGEVIIGEEAAGSGTRQRRRPPNESSFGGAIQGLRGAPPLRDQGTPDGGHDQEPDTGTKTGDSAGGLRAVGVMKRWYKPLPQSDAQQLDPLRSSRSAMVTLVRANHPIESARYFRDDFFSDAAWSVAASGKEEATVEFYVDIAGFPSGTRELTLVFDPELAAGQGNRTTLLRWGEELNDHLRANNHTGEVLTLERLAGGSYRLIVSDEPTGPFRP